MTKATGKKTAVVINRQAGSIVVESPDVLRRRFAGLFQAAGLDAEIHWADPAAMADTLNRVKDAGAEAIVVGGGDGTLNTAANVLVDTPTALGVLPVGTFNHFARDLGMPVLLEEAAHALAEGRIETIDVGEVNGKVFINNASIGVYPHVVSRREMYREQLGLRKLPAMGYALLGAFWRLPVLQVWVQMDGERELIRASFVFIGNNRYDVEPLGFIHRRSLAEGGLGVFYPRRIGRLALFKIVFKTLLGRMQDLPELEKRWTRQVKIDARHGHVKLAMDGEVVTLETPLHFRIRRHALRVIRPKHYEGAASG